MERARRAAADFLLYLTYLIRMNNHLGLYAFWATGKYIKVLVEVFMHFSAPSDSGRSANWGMQQFHDLALADAVRGQLCV